MQLSGLHVVTRTPKRKQARGYPRPTQGPEKVSKNPHEQNQGAATFVGHLKGSPSILLSPARNIPNTFTNASDDPPRPPPTSKCPPINPKKNPGVPQYIPKDTHGSTEFLKCPTGPLTSATNQGVPKQALEALKCGLGPLPNPIKGNSNNEIGALCSPSPGLY